MKETPSLSNSIREPNDALDIVRAWAAIFGSNLEDRVGEGGLTANMLSSSAKWLRDAIVPIVALDMVRARFDLGSNRDVRSGDGGLMMNAFSSLSSSTLFERKLFEEYVRLWG
jgi:hypothetical protein